MNESRCQAVTMRLRARAEPPASSTLRFSRAQQRPMRCEMGTGLGSWFCVSNGSSVGDMVRRLTFWPSRTVNSSSVQQQPLHPLELTRTALWLCLPELRPAHDSPWRSSSSCAGTGRAASDWLALFSPETPPRELLTESRKQRTQSSHHRV
jgi:hypothetical protein